MGEGIGVGWGELCEASDIDWSGFGENLHRQQAVDLRAPYDAPTIEITSSESKTWLGGKSCQRWPDKWRLDALLKFRSFLLSATSKLAATTKFDSSRSLLSFSSKSTSDELPTLKILLEPQVHLPWSSPRPALPAFAICILSSCSRLTFRATWTA